eukprot:1196939-Amphidinium_carterae.2
MLSTLQKHSQGHLRACFYEATKQSVITFTMLLPDCSVFDLRVEGLLERSNSASALNYYARTVQT